LKVVLSRRANLDLMAQIDWLAGLSSPASAKAEAAIRDHLKMLAEFPTAGRAINPEERQWVIPFGRDGFIAIYRIDPDRLVIGRILHCRQDRG
jgi:plasmid stabilization system protein ParE